MKKNNIEVISCVIGFIVIIMMIGLICVYKFRNVSGVTIFSNNRTNSTEELANNSEIVGSVNYLSSSTAQDTERSIATISTDNWDLTKVDIVYDTNNVAVPVPKGYVASGADGEHTVNTGFVIYEGDGEVTTENAWEESKTRNQWVWVPVSDSSRIYSTATTGKKSAKLYNYSSTGRTSTSGVEPGILTSRDNERYFARYNMISMTRDKLYQELQEEYDSTIESIEKYGGFYIGRYETGNLSSKVPVVKRMNTSIYSQTWYTMYSKMKYLGANSNVKSNMIWGSLWDETLQWFVDSGCKTYEEVGTDSTSWGNYYNATFEYTTTSGGTSTKSTSSSTRIPTGSTEYTNANNIYDMAGNVWDWTLEANGTNNRRFRGGNYGNDGTGSPADNRDDSFPDNSSYYLGFRAYFYIK